MKQNTTTTTPEIDKGKELTRKALAKVERYLEKTPGSVKRLAEFLTKRMGRNVARQRVTRWFAGDLESRPEPLFSTGLLMLEWWKLEQKRAERDKIRAAESTPAAAAS
jgi:hypothetical protein